MRIPRLLRGLWSANEFFRRLHIKLLECKQKDFVFGLAWGASYKVVKTMDFHVELWALGKGFRAKKNAALTWFMSCGALCELCLGWGGCCHKKCRERPRFNVALLCRLKLPPSDVRPTDNNQIQWFYYPNQSCCCSEMCCHNNGWLWWNLGRF